MDEKRFVVLGLEPVIKHIQKRSKNPEEELKVAKKKIKALEKKIDDYKAKMLDVESELRTIGYHELANSLWE